MTKRYDIQAEIAARAYEPRPIETHDVILPSRLVYLAELLAANAHDIWATERISQGWKYGHKRDDNAKTHPCLVPYDWLPESEKDMDRALANQLLKSIVKLGFEISAPPN